MWANRTPRHRLRRRDRRAQDLRSVTEGLRCRWKRQPDRRAILTPSETGLDPLLLTRRSITLDSISVGSRADFEAMNIFLCGMLRRAARARVFRGQFRKALGTHPSFWATGRFSGLDEDDALAPASPHGVRPSFRSNDRLPQPGSIYRSGQKVGNGAL